MIYLKQLLHRATFYRGKKSQNLEGRLNEQHHPYLPRSLHDKPVKSYEPAEQAFHLLERKKNLMLIRYLLSAGNRCLSPSSCFAELQGLHAFSWQRLYETRDTLLRTKYLEVLDFLLK